MIARKQKAIRWGTSRVVVIPSIVSAGVDATVAIERLMLVDPTGRIDENVLAEILQDVVEPYLYRTKVVES